MHSLMNNRFAKVYQNTMPYSQDIRSCYLICDLLISSEFIIAKSNIFSILSHCHHYDIVHIYILNLAITPCNISISQL